MLHYSRRKVVVAVLLCCSSFLVAAPASRAVDPPGTFSIPGPFTAKDPGVRPGGADAGGPLPGLSAMELAFFQAAFGVFQEVQSVQGTIANTEGGLGPRFNLDSCSGCHIQPTIGGSSPATNPQVAVAKREGAVNDIPSFVTLKGPIREARFKFNPDGSRDGGVHALFTITGRTDAPGCHIQQPDFRTAQLLRNVSFRIPTPTFGLGLIESIDDRAIVANLQVNRSLKQSLGISGHVNTNGNDGTITRFGWKAQNKSLEIFSGEAYNVEQGVTNDLFPQERDETPGCTFNVTPESASHIEAGLPTETPSDATMFAIFMRFLAPPSPAPDSTSIVRGRNLFGSLGCVACHTPTLRTGRSSHPALNDKPVNLYSDLLVHGMGPDLADDIVQGSAGPDEFRTAPLWGVGKRIFFLHDGRTSDLKEAITAHASQGNGRFPASEANRVIQNFNGLNEIDKQHVLNFLRSL